MAMGGLSSVRTQTNSTESEFHGWHLDRPIGRRRVLDRVLTIFGVIGDLAALYAAMWAAYWIRFDSGWIPVTKGAPLTLENYVQAMLAVMLVWLVVFTWLDMYRPQRWIRALDESYRVAIAGGVVLLVVMALSFCYRAYEFSRLTAGIAYGIAVVLVSILRACGLRVASWLGSRPGFRRRVAVLGAPEVARRFKGHSRQVCFQSADPASGVPQVGQMLADGELDEVVLSRGGLSTETLMALFRTCEQAGAEALVVPDPIDTLLARGGREDVGGMAVVRVRDVPLNGLQRLLKRLFDIIVSGLLLLLLLPLLLVVGLLVRGTSAGPALFRQRRVTESEKEFTILKFRSMVQDAEADTGAVWARKGDPRTTPLGRFLRRSSLDELPQLWNVLVGDMSLIGPRPERPEFVAQFVGRVPRYLDRHRMKAGITGWAQVNGERGGDSRIEDRTRYDVYYVDNWSLMLDLQILVKTLFEVLFHRGAG